VRRATTVLLLAAQAAWGATPPAPAVAVFKGEVELVRISVVVRDKSGNPVRGLKASDFTITEDGKEQTINAFGFEEVPVEAMPAEAPPAESPGAPTPVPPILKTPPAAASGRVGADTLAGRRLIVLLFDTTGMAPDGMERTIHSARDYVDKRMSAADLVAVATVEGGLAVYQDFTTDRTKLHAALDVIQSLEGATWPEAEPATTGGGEGGGGEAPPSPDTSDLTMFGIDQRLRALETLANTLLPLRQKKSVLYFSSGMSGAGEANQVELRAAIDRAVRANLSVYPIDSRGLEAVVPGGDASRPSSMSADAFSGREVLASFDQRLGSQDSLTSLASGTGGKTFFDTNDFSGAFEQVLKDTSSYYVLGYASTNPRQDGKFRRVKIRVKGDGLKVEHRSGYYAGKDFQHQNDQDRERAMREQLLTELSLTDLPVCLRTAYFRAEEEPRFRVPISVGVPGSAVPFTRSGDEDRASLDLLGVVRDGEGRIVAEIRDTIKVARKVGEDVRSKNVQYLKVLTITPGRYTLKIVVRENKDGAMGSFETDIVVPYLQTLPVRLSSVVLGTQVQPVKGKTENPLARDGSELVQSLTHVVSAQRPIYFYYEVYDPTHPKGGGAASLRTGLQFLRGGISQYETPLVDVTSLSSPERNAAVLQFAVPPGSLKPGFYWCQVTVIDLAAGTFAFPRVPLLVR
jgi:VWFA-related protein